MRGSCQPLSNASRPEFEVGLGEHGLDRCTGELVGGAYTSLLTWRNCVSAASWPATAARCAAVRSAAPSTYPPGSEIGQVASLLLMDPDDPGHSGIIKPSRPGQGGLQQLQLVPGDGDALPDITANQPTRLTGYQFCLRSSGALTPPSLRARRRVRGSAGNPVRPAARSGTTCQSPRASVSLRRCCSPRPPIRRMSGMPGVQYRGGPSRTVPGQRLHRGRHLVFFATSSSRASTSVMSIVPAFKAASSSDRAFRASRAFSRAA